MRYIIYGAGAVGGVIGARLHQAGRDVILIARGAHLDAMRHRSLRLQSPDEDVTLPIPAVAHPSEIAFTEDDVVLLTMKSQHTSDALDALRLVAPDVPVVCAQNGVANERMALRRFERVYGMMVVLPATHLEPGVVQADGAGISGVLVAGRYPRGSDTMIENVCADLTAARFAASADGDVMRWKHAKLLSNLNNIIQAACGLDANARDLARAVRDEALRVYAAAGIVHASDDEFRARRSPMRLGAVAGERMRAGGSTWQSLARGAGSLETDYLNGEIALLGRLHGVETPLNAALTRIAARLVAENAAPGTITPEEIQSEALKLVEQTAENATIVQRGLDERAAEYVKQQLQTGNTLSKLLLTRVESERATITARVPDWVSEDDLYQFELSIMPEGPRVRNVARVFTLDNDLARYAVADLKSDAHAFLLIEDNTAKPTDPYILERCSTRWLALDDEVYHLMLGSEPESQVDTLSETHSWRYVGAMGSDATVARFKRGDHFSRSDLETLVERTREIVIGAYHQEAYLYVRFDEASDRSATDTTPAR